MSGRPTLGGRHLHLDCFAGIAGDMFLGAMFDLGVPEDVVRRGLSRLDLGGYALRVGRVSRMGIDACDVQVDIGRPTGSDATGHRTWGDIRELIVAAELPPGAATRALDIFERVARAEAKVHGTTVDHVHFHEVGAVDSIVDIVGAALALDHLAPLRVTSRPVPLGHGSVRCAHGTIPVPAPAALEILTGARVEDGGAATELCTPTGAAIVASTVSGFSELPAGEVVAVGYGAGDAVLDDRPNLLRVVLVDDAAAGAADTAAVVVEANIDDMSPEWCAPLMDRLFEAGARDVWYTPVVMKKGRPALSLSALCAPDALERIAGALLAESTSIGLRYHRVGRRVLSRDAVVVETRFGPITVKVARGPEGVLNAAPEHEECLAAARRHQVPLKVVHAAAVAAHCNLADSQGRG